MIDISRLRSYLFWRKEISNHPDKYLGYTFPEPLNKWKELTGEDCPICKTYSTLLIGTEWVYCLCSTLQWIDEQGTMQNDYETPIQPASLKELKVYKDPKYPTSHIDLLNLLKDVTSWLRYPSHWMYIAGGLGSGKTHILRAIKTALPALCLYISADQFQQALFSARTKDDEVQELIRVLSTVPILLFDDWGLEHDNAWTNDALASIINSRYAAPYDLLVVMTSNYELKTILGSVDITKRRIASRISGEQTSWYLLTQPDLRANEEYHNGR